jgi:manganese/zinc/iron transport system permease protein
MVGPAAAAYLLTDRLDQMLLYSAGLGVASAVGGYWVAHWLDASIAGSMATMVGVLFVGVWLLAPERGLLALAQRRARQRLTFAQTMLAIHLSNHEGRPEASQENRCTRTCTGARASPNGWYGRPNTRGSWSAPNGSSR